MRATAETLHEFVSSFGLPAYSIESVPKDVSAPYLTYPLNEPEWSEKATWYIQGWYRTTSNAQLSAKADEIISEIGTGIRLSTGVGYISIYPESPLVQILVDGDFRSFYINLSINVYQMPGAYPEPVETPGNGSDDTPGANTEIQEEGE